jgi:hypothetical protein
LWKGILIKSVNAIADTAMIIFQTYELYFIKNKNNCITVVILLLFEIEEFNLNFWKILPLE